MQADQSTSEKKEEEEEQEKQEKEDPLDKSVLDDFTEGMIVGKSGECVSLTSLPLCLLASSFCICFACTCVCVRLAFELSSDLFLADSTVEVPFPKDRFGGHLNDVIPETD